MILEAARSCNSLATAFCGASPLAACTTLRFLQRRTVASNSHRPPKLANSPLIVIDALLAGGGGSAIAAMTDTDGAQAAVEDVVARHLREAAPRLVDMLRSDVLDNAPGRELPQVRHPGRGA